MVLNNATLLDEFQINFSSSVAFDEFTEPTERYNNPEWIANRFQPVFRWRETNQTNNSKDPQTSPIVRYTVAGSLGTLALAVIFCFIWRRIKKRNEARLQLLLREGVYARKKKEKGDGRFYEMKPPEFDDGGRRNAETLVDSQENDADDQSESNEFNQDSWLSWSSSENDPPSQTHLTFAQIHENLLKSRPTESEHDVSGMTVPLASDDCTKNPVKAKPRRARNNKLNERREPSLEIISHEESTF